MWGLWTNMPNMLNAARTKHLTTILNPVTRKKAPHRAYKEQISWSPTLTFYMVIEVYLNTQNRRKWPAHKTSVLHSNRPFIHRSNKTQTDEHTKSSKWRALLREPITKSNNTEQCMYRKHWFGKYTQSNAVHNEYFQLMQLNHNYFRSI